MIYLTSQLHDSNWELRSVGGGGLIDSSIDVFDGTGVDRYQCEK